MAKLKDGFYKQTASSIGSDLLVLLAGGGAKPISDFALADGTNATGTWSINISGKSEKVTCSEATSDTNRPIVVTNKSNGLYYTTKATLNYSTGNITAPTFTGALKGNADTATTASKLSTVSKKAWGQTYWTSGGIPTDISGDMTGVGNITIASNGNVDRFITFDTTSTRNWRIGYLGTGSGDANYLIFQSTKILTIADGWHDMLKIGCETGNATLAGQLTAAKFVGPLNNTLTFAAGAFSAKTYNNSEAVTVNIPTQTSHLNNDSGFLTSRGYIGTTAVQASSAAQALTGITTANFSGAVTLSGTTASTAILKFSRSGDATWNYIIWPGDTNVNCRLAFGYSNTSSACYYYMTNASFNPVATNARSLGTSSARWSTVYGVNGNFSGSNAYPLVIDSSHATENGLIIRMSGTDKAWIGYTSGTGAYLYTYTGPHKIGVSDSGVGFVDGNTILHSGNSSVADGGSTWGSKLTVKINGTTKTLTIPANPNTWRGITNDYDVTTPSDTISLSQTGAKSLQRNVRSFKRFTGTNTNGGYDLNTLTDGMIYNYGSSGYWKNGPSGMSYGRVLNLKDGSGGSIAGQLAWDTNHNSTTDTTRNLWWRVSDDGTFTEAKWHRIAYAEEIPAVTNYYWANIKVSSSSSTTTYPTFGSLYVYNDSCNNSNDALAYFRHRGTNDWCIIVDKGGYDWGIDVRSFGPNAMKVAGRLTLGQKVTERKYTWLKLTTPGHTGSDGWCVGVDDTSDNSYLYFKYTESDALKCYIRHDGCMYAAHFYESSDIKLKINIENISTTDNIPQLKKFNWKSDGSIGYGLIAQELEEMGYSELVEEAGDHKTVNYSAALSLIVGKLQVKIKELEKEIEILKNK